MLGALPLGAKVTAGVLVFGLAGTDVLAVVTGVAGVVLMGVGAGTGLVVTGGLLVSGCGVTGA